MNRDRLSTLSGGAFGRRGSFMTVTRFATTASLALGLVFSAPVLPGEGAPA